MIPEIGILNTSIRKGGEKIFDFYRGKFVEIFDCEGNEPVRFCTVFNKVNACLFISSNAEYLIN